uniref:Aminopeptidase N-like N-terminal domain-containing protein n=1 Tax=Panagrolaimus sp. ES5 TaxID=591445 RepID=A0AC34G0I6_9BILA
MGRGTELEEIDLSDRRGLIAMAEIYANGSSPSEGYHNNAFDDGSATYIRSGRNGSGDITKILHHPSNGTSLSSSSCGGSRSAPSSPSKPAMTATVTNSNGNGSTKFRQNGTPVGASGGSKRVSCSILTLLILLFITLAALLISIIATYFITKNHLESLNPSLNNGNGLNLSGNNNTSMITDNSTLIAVTDGSSENGEDEQDHSGPSPQELRLPKSLEPIWYNLTMRINVPGFVPIAPEKNLTFSAAMIIKLLVKESTKRIELNAITLNLSNNTEDYSILIEGLKVATNQTLPSNEDPDHAPLSSREDLNSTETVTRRKRQTHVRLDSKIKITKITLNETLEKVIFELSDELEKDAEYYFQFRYTGYITNKLAGLYLTTYQDVDGKMHYAAVTQMEPTDARRMVPCFDEPEFKAIWKIRVHHPLGSKAVSNAREIVEEEPDE